MMEPEFDELQISHPEIVRLFDEHLALHQQEMAKQQQAQMAAQQAAKGAPESVGGTPAGDGATPGAGEQQQPGQGFDFNRSFTDVPDVIGRGVTRLSAMRSNPQPKR